MGCMEEREDSTPPVLARQDRAPWGAGGKEIG